MKMSIDVMKAVIERLQNDCGGDEVDNAIAALRAAISEAEKCEHVPVTTFGGDYCIKCDAPVESNDYPTPVPAGWQLVPVEPTEAMKVAGSDALGVYHCGSPSDIYKAMLAAAPKPGESHD
jgi:hypothetical protein